MKNTQVLLEQAGWWGKNEVLDPATGEMVTTTFDASRLKLIYDTNTRMAYSAGLWQRIERNKDAFPYIRYITMRDEKVRLSHRAWDNVTLPVDDPFWDTHFPPCGWRCRCRATSINQKDYDAGLSPNGELLNKVAPKVEYRDWVNKSTGVVEQVPVGIDPGFGYNPGKASARADNLASVVIGKLDALPAPMRSAALAPQIVGDVSADFQQAVNTALEAIPGTLRAEVFARGYQVVLGNRLVDIEPNLTGVPRGYEGTDTTWENVDGVALKGLRIGIAETSLSETGNVLVTDATRAGQLLRHELGHALDISLSISASPDFVFSYNKDAELLNPLLDKLSDPAARRQLKYLLQDGSAGQQEAFAELFAEFYGGGTSDAINAAVAVAFPDTYATVIRLLKNIINGS
jgi:SPP1 gp7 family putative phage head morphogenesis protein